MYKIIKTIFLLQILNRKFKKIKNNLINVLPTKEILIFDTENRKLEVTIKKNWKI